MAGSVKDPRTFFVNGTVVQYEFVLRLYDEAIKLKAKQKKKNSEELLKLDKWYQYELPKRIKSRGKDAHLTHEELVKCMKWKLYRGKFSPRLKDLITMNTPRVCMNETKKAFRALSKREDLSSAIQALCNLKGVGPAMASVILTAAFPNLCGFMADECLMAIPEIESIDYTTKELLNFVEQLKITANRLNKEGGGNSLLFSPHRVEQALWVHFVLTDLNKDMLNDMPTSSATTIQTPTENGSAQEDLDSQKKNGNSLTSEENTDSMDSSANKENLTSNMENLATNTNGTDPEDSSSRDFSACEEDTNDSMEPASEAPSETPSSEDSQEPNTEVEEREPQEPSAKKLKLDDGLQQLDELQKVKELQNIDEMQKIDDELQQ